jgi:hypothetical protein
MVTPPRTHAREGWANRIIRSGLAPVDQIQFSGKNWRIHPIPQQQALAGVLSEVGWVQNVIINERTGNLIDGHARVTVADRNGETEIPAVWVDLSEEEEALVLATIDPLSAMAAVDREQLAALLEEVSTGDAALQAMLDSLAQDAGIVPPVDPTGEWDGMPEFQHEDKMAYQTIALHFKDRDAADAFAELVGQTITPQTRFLWYPDIEIEHYADKAYTTDDGR